MEIVPIPKKQSNENVYVNVGMWVDTTFWIAVKTMFTIQVCKHTWIYTLVLDSLD